MTDRTNKERDDRSYSHSDDDSSEDREETKRNKKRSRRSNTHQNNSQPSQENNDNQNKKKKDDKAVNQEDDFEDLLERGWFYVDSSGEKQGPFSTKEMKEWYIAGFFNNDLLVKRVSDTTFQRIADRDEFARLERKPQLASYAALSMLSYDQRLEAESAPNPFYQDFPAYYDASFEPETTNDNPPPPPLPVVDEETGSYSQAAYFTTLGGRFSAGDQASHWKKKKDYQRIKMAECYLTTWMWMPIKNK